MDPLPKEKIGHSDHWSPAVLLERATTLRKLARQGDGAASETLREYPGHCAMLLFRSRDGAAEVHENFADVFYVLDGHATLVTSGAVAGAAGRDSRLVGRGRQKAGAEGGRCGARPGGLAPSDAAPG